VDSRGASAPTEAGAGDVLFAWDRILVNGLIGTAVGLLLLILAVTAAEVPPPPAPGDAPGGYVTLFYPPRSSFEVLLLHGDGQAYAALAQDPTLSHAEVFREGPTQAGYFAQRPVLYYAVWALSFGQPSLVQPAYIAVMGLSAGLLAAAATALVQARGRGQNDRLALLVLVLPGAVGGLSWFGQELLGLGFAAAGLALWTRGTATRVAAVACFVVAGLTRETMLLVPFVLGLNELVRRRARVREVAVLAVAPAVYLAWTLVVASRFGITLGSASRRGPLVAPFKGVLDSAGLWGPADVVVLLLILGLAVAALVQERRTPESWLIVVYVALATVLSHEALTSWQDFGRILLPSAVFAVVILLPVPRPAGFAVRERSL
jgi:hypothetical protein